MPFQTAETTVSGGSGNQPEDARAGSCCKTAVDCCVCRRGIRTREQVSAYMRQCPRPVNLRSGRRRAIYQKWCKDSKMVLYVTIDDVMAEFLLQQEKSLYPRWSRKIPVATSGYVLGRM